jgi:hypothetical protein
VQFREFKEKSIMRIRCETITLLAVMIVLIALLVRLPPLLHGLSDDLGIIYDEDGDPVVGTTPLAQAWASSKSSLVMGDRPTLTDNSKQVQDRIERNTL